MCLWAILAALIFCASCTVLLLFYGIATNTGLRWLFGGCNCSVHVSRLWHSHVFEACRQVVIKLLLTDQTLSCPCLMACPGLLAPQCMLCMLL